MRFDFVAHQRFCQSTIVLVLVAAAVFAGRSSAAEPTAVPLAQSSLPSGDVIAAEVLGTKQRQQHPSFIFFDDFESGGIGDQWDETRNPNGNTLSLVTLDDETAPVGSRSLKVTAHLGKDTGGGMTKWFPSAEDVFVRFYVRFAADSDYIHHFVTLRANRGLTGGDRWSGFGGAGNRPPGDQRFSTALEPWGNWRRWPAPGRWNFYSYWHQMKASPGRHPQGQMDLL